MDWEGEWRLEGNGYRRGVDVRVERTREGRGLGRGE